MAGDIARIPLAGGDKVVLAQTTGGTGTALATDGTTVYFSDSAGTKSVPLAGGAVRTLSTVSGAGLALVGSDLVVTSPGRWYVTASAAVYGVPISGGPPTVLAANEVGASLPLACGSDICWAIDMTGDAAPTCCTGTGSIRRLHSDGTISTIPAVFPLTRVVYDGENFFATAVGDASPGFAYRIAASGGEPVYLGEGAAVAVDDRCVYAASVSSGVWTVAKSYTPP